MTEGYNCIIHLHTTVLDVQVSAIMAVYSDDEKMFVKNNYLKSNQQGYVKLKVKRLYC